MDETRQEQEESKARRLLDLLLSNAAAPARVNAITIIGTQRTRPSFMERVTAPLMTAKTVADVVNGTQEVAERLARFDIFDSMQVMIDSADRDPLAPADALNVIYQLEEKKRMYLTTGTEIGNNEGNMNGSITVRNLFGGAETLETVASFGTRNNSSFQFCLASPVGASPDARVDINAHHVLRSDMLISSYDELSRGAGIRYKALSRLGIHTLSYDCTVRSVPNIAGTASRSVRTAAGHTLKSSIRHALVHDRRDDPLLPTNGYYVRLENEWAGVLDFGNMHFLKSEIEAQACTSLGKTSDDQPNHTLNLNVRAGWLANRNNDPRASMISDRFMVGGPLSVRGFRNAGIGPHDHYDALGGDAYWSLGASLISKIPRYESKPVRTHVFFNAGSSVRHQNDGAKGTLHNLTQSPSSSVGVGIIFRYSIARIEANYCIPLTATKSDLLSRGFQVGIGLNFL